jgi:ribosomal protein S1
LIHISELAWQRIDDPSELYKVGQVVEAEVINVDGSKIFLSAKKLQKDPWDGVGEKYKINQTVKVTILKVNPFGLFVKLDNEIHGLAHVSQMSLAPGEKIDELYKPGTEVELEIISIEPKEHRLGLAAIKKKPVEKAEDEVKVEKKGEEKVEKTEKAENPKKKPRRKRKPKKANKIRKYHYGKGGQRLAFSLAKINLNLYNFFVVY